jgi:hypothetical protein
MLVLKYEDLPDGATTEEKLDVAVNRACIHFHIVSLMPIILDQRDVPDEKQTGFFGEAFLRMVYVGDARARCAEDDYLDNKELAYLEFVKAGLRRVAKHAPSTRGNDRVGFFAEHRTGIQIDAYHDSLDMFMSPELVGLSPREHAERVAELEIQRTRTQEAIQLSAPFN